MATTIEQSEEIDLIAEKVAGWPTDARIRLINRISRTDDTDPAPEISDEWLATINRRAEEMRNGRVAMISMEEADAIVRKTVGL